MSEEDWGLRDLQPAGIHGVGVWDEKPITSPDWDIIDNGFTGG